MTTHPESLADEIEALYSRASENDCRCDQPETHCPLCSAWGRARNLSVKILTTATAELRREVESAEEQVRGIRIALQCGNEDPVKTILHRMEARTELISRLCATEDKLTTSEARVKELEAAITPFAVYQTIIEQKDLSEPFSLGHWRSKPPNLPEFVADVKFEKRHFARARQVQLSTTTPSPVTGRTDAERLDWLEHECPNVSFTVTPNCGPWLRVNINESLRQAIDAAMDAEKGKE